ncbi:hypothetical protein BGZ82_002858 [Podila clonocystis]|nr:hypothetical protein BGZ82_002858 [Podila clonocystis]
MSIARFSFAVLDATTDLIHETSAVGLRWVNKVRAAVSDNLATEDDRPAGQSDHDSHNTTVAPITSQTKAFTAAAIGELVAEGKMDWTKTPVNVYLPEFQLKDPLFTLQLNLMDLLSHHSYNNICYAVAGEAAANVAGVEYEDLVCNKDAQSGKYEPGELDQNYMTDAPSGDMYSSVLEMAVWARTMMGTGALDGNQVLNKESTEYIQTGHSIMTGTRRGPEFRAVEAYGLGWMIDTYKGQLVNCHIMVLTNMDSAQLPIFLPYYINDSLLNLPKTKDWLMDIAVADTQNIYKEAEGLAKGSNLPPQIKNSTVSRDLKDYVGEYEHPYFNPIFVWLESSRADKDGNTEIEDVEQESKSRLQFQYSNLWRSCSTTIMNPFEHRWLISLLRILCYQLSPLAMMDS